MSGKNAKLFFINYRQGKFIYFRFEDTPLQYPSPSQLKKKFIIKNKRKRIFGDLAEMKSSYEKLYISTIEQSKKKNENSILMNKNAEKNQNINNTNNIQKQNK